MLECFLLTLTLRVCMIGRVHGMAAGENFSIVCLDTGELYSFGFGQQGQVCLRACAGAAVLYSAL